jgi:hypothetical protein
MKIAHLILTHKNPGQLQRMLEAMKHPAFHFYIHLDKKTDRRAFAHLYDNESVFEIKNRTSVHWGGWGTIQATINGWEEIPIRNYGYINVISGQDFPIKSPVQIYDFFAQRKGKEFITIESIEDTWKEAAPRVLRYHLINWSLPGKFRLEKLVNKLLPPRKFPLPFAFVGRANWFTLTPAAIEYCLDFLKKNPKVVRYFKYCWGADEFIFSMILYHSHFRERIVNNVVYVDWTGQTQGHPRILNSSDFDKLMASDKLFARKFDSNEDAAILDLLEQYIRRQTIPA